MQKRRLCFLRSTRRCRPKAGRANWIQNDSKNCKTFISISISISYCNVNSISISNVNSISISNINSISISISNVNSINSISNVNSTSSISISISIVNSISINLVFV